ncbi:hypothetical protein VH569_03220 [Azospirillum sp. 11R-A]|uniref:hypothetical protein n=1 Tax=Azospirillum sp. 11R-A TaxID=3111634 RepID=UPI003C21B324
MRLYHHTDPVIVLRIAQTGIFRPIKGMSADCLMNMASNVKDAKALAAKRGATMVIEWDGEPASAANGNYETLSPNVLYNESWRYFVMPETDRHLKVTGVILESDVTSVDNPDEPNLMRRISGTPAQWTASEFTTHIMLLFTELGSLKVVRP